MKNAQWIYNLWYQGDLILNDLNEDDWHVIFNGLLIVPRIDYQTEEILKYSANKYPENIIKFFHKRVEIKSKKKSTIGDWYDGVPFNFHKLGEVLRPHSRIIIPILLGWYKDGGKKHNWLFKWEASHLFEEIFPKLDTVAEKALITLANIGCDIFSS
jgi:hypothetical protein